MIVLSVVAFELVTYYKACNTIDMHAFVNKLPFTDVLCTCFVQMFERTKSITNPIPG